MTPRGRSRRTLQVCLQVCLQVLLAGPGRVRIIPVMTVRPPRQTTTRIWTDNPAAALDYEIAQEKASTLGRLGRALEAALAALHAFDAAATEPSAERAQGAPRAGGAGRPCALAVRGAA
jgi:hypothetical protein